jgi:hypothetical protein
MQDPQIAAMIGQNPQAQAITGAIQAHIAEHFAFRYRQQIEQQLGAPLPYFKEDDDEHISEEIEVQISRAVATAAQQLTMQNMAQAQQQEAQQQAQDPIIQMQMQELALKGEEQKRKAAKDASDVQLKQQEIQNTHSAEMARIELETFRLGTNIAKDKEKSTMAKEKVAIDTDIAGYKMGIDISKSKDQVDVQKGQLMAQIINARNKKGKQ